MSEELQSTLLEISSYTSSCTTCLFPILYLAFNLHATALFEKVLLLSLCHIPLLKQHYTDMKHLVVIILK